MPFFKTFLLAVCATALACSQPMRDPDVDETVRMPEDMRTNLPSDTPLRIEIPTLRPWLGADEFVRNELPSWHESIRVVRWPSREPMEGRWVFSSAIPVSFTFEPSAPLPRGWYAMQVNFGTISVPRESGPGVHIRNGAAGQVVIDGWNTARFHVGSFPVLTLVGGVDVPRNGLDGGGGFRLEFSEQVTFEGDILPADPLRVTVNGLPIRCESPGWTCETPPTEGTVRVELTPLTGASLPLRYTGEGGRPVWVAQTGEWFGKNNVDDSVFTEEGL